MDLDIIYASLVADKMSKTNWGGCGCSSVWVTLAVMLYLVGYASYWVYGWATDRFTDSIEYDYGSSWAAVARIAIVCCIVLFWVLLFALLLYLARRNKN